MSATWPGTWRTFRSAGCRYWIARSVWSGWCHWATSPPSTSRAAAIPCCAVWPRRTEGVAAPSGAASKRMANVHIGISGWRYVPWRGDFYPQGLKQKNELAFASRAVNSIEINGSFYALQRPSSYQSWYQQTPADFVFSVKAPRYITHVRRLREVEGALANFLASGVLGLGEKLGPLLWQFPPSFRFDAALMEDF